MKQRTDITILLFVLLLLGLMVSTLNVGCSSGDNGPKAGAIDACALLKEVHPEVLLGEPVGTGNKSIDQHDASGIVSLCGYTAKSDWKKTVSLLVKYYPEYTNPETAKAFLERQDFGEFKVTSREIPDLGDVAVALSDANSLQLRVFWKKHYQMSVVFTEPGDNTETLNKARSVAESVIDKL